MRRRRSFALVAALLLSFLLPGQMLAHEGHDHDAGSKAAIVTALPRAEAASEAFELVAVAAGGELIIYLDRFATNEPVPDASVVVETPQGSLEAERASDGTYRLPAPWATPPGHYDLIVTVTTGSELDVLALSLDVPPANEAHAAGRGFAASARAQGVADRISSDGSGGVFGLLAAFVGGGIGGVLFARRRRAIPMILALAVGLPLFTDGTFAHEGEDHGTPDKVRAAGRDVAQILPDGGVFVPKSTQRILAIRTTIAQSSAYRRTVELPGRIIPDPNASGFVQAAVGGRLSPPAGGFPRLGTPVKKGDVLAYVTPPLQAIDASDIRQRQGELDQQISIVERRLARYETLVPGGAVARTQLEETRLELQGLKDRRAALETAKREPEPLVAPVDGIIADGSPVAGQVAQTNAVVFQIIDPARLWVEALSYEALPPLQAATARLGDKSLRLQFRGAGFADRNQSIPIHFAIEGDVAGVRAGQFVTVFAETPDEQRGLAVPRTSIVRTSSGQDSVYEHVAAERFEQRPVRIEPLDGERVLISQGLSPGKRVVVQGAELIDHIR
jgi:hypothetical protein